MGGGDECADFEERGSVGEKGDEALKMCSN